MGQRKPYNLHTDGGEQAQKRVKRDSSQTDQSTSGRSLTQAMSGSMYAVRTHKHTSDGHTHILYALNPLGLKPFAVPPVLNPTGREWVDL